MLKLKIRDQKVRKKFYKNELINTTLKYVYVNYLNKNKFKDSYKLRIFKNFKQKNGHKTKIIRRCILNNRSRGSIRPFNISRMKLRELFQFGIIPGYKKSVW